MSEEVGTDDILSIRNGHGDVSTSFGYVSYDR